VEGSLVRFGRYIPLPDIEAQLAPNSYMYTPSMTYTYDNYTNSGLQATLALTKTCFTADDEPAVHAQSRRAKSPIGAERGPARYELSAKVRLWMSVLSTH
jgi:hypothetical protein